MAVEEVEAREAVKSTSARGLLRMGLREVYGAPACGATAVREPSL
ncbi:hypothetical protein FTUN_0992 [Frigoriglobus tundricola]|uniref:Uncharacterized protein n=1 Tax=Frigoriglobus tundricola TaxID=2774151 RepID=A0A6M5YJP1_9BACT|nr:hypothetical protein FTUN_0992 [Frigoriglobus tundricola]